MADKRGDEMPVKKIGRPTLDPKKDRITVRLDGESSDILDKYCNQESLKPAEAVRKAIKKLKEDIKK